MATKKVYKDFESAIGRLEEITGALESGDLTLEQSITLYTEGVEIAAVCNKKLGEAEGQIAKLTKMSDKFTLDSLADEVDE